MVSTRRRTILKGITWKTLSVVVFYLLTQSINLSIKYIIITLVLFYIHERTWKKINYGKVNK